MKRARRGGGSVAVSTLHLLTQDLDLDLEWIIGEKPWIILSCLDEMSSK